MCVPGVLQTPSTGLRHPSFHWREVPESEARSVGGASVFSFFQRSSVLFLSLSPDITLCGSLDSKRHRFKTNSSVSLCKCVSVCICVCVVVGGGGRGVCSGVQ